MCYGNVSDRLITYIKTLVCGIVGATTSILTYTITQLVASESIDPSKVLKAGLTDFATGGVIDIGKGSKVTVDQFVKACVNGIISGLVDRLWFGGEKTK